MSKHSQSRCVLVTGGAGYVGSVLVPKLLDAGYHVKVLDLFWFGEDVLEAVSGHAGLELIHGDIRDQALLKRVMPGCDTVIHLACISNDPSFELNPGLGKSINFDAFAPLVDISRDSGVSRFIYASSSSVYGVKNEVNVSEDLELTPLTDYSKYKAMCEDILLDRKTSGFITLILRPATVCGYAPRLRLDLTVNILTNHAVNRGAISVFGGSQLRPNIHIEDITDLYVHCMQCPESLIDGEIFNAGGENHSVREIADLVRATIGSDVSIEVTPTDDQRSYHISSEKIRKALGFTTQHEIVDAVLDLKTAFDDGRVPDPLTDDRYFNLKRMQNLQIT